MGNEPFCYGRCCCGHVTVPILWTTVIKALDLCACHVKQWLWNHCLILLVTCCCPFGLGCTTGPRSLPPMAETVTKSQFYRISGRAADQGGFFYKGRIGKYDYFSVQQGSDSRLIRVGKNNRLIRAPFPFTAKEYGLTLHYLCTNSDLIAVVDVIAGVGPNRDLYTGDSFPPSAIGRVVRTLKGSAKKGSAIMISCEPEVLPRNVLGIRLVLYNGKTLCFLSKDGKGFRPLTDRSILHSENDGTVDLSWKKGICRVGIEDAVNRVIETMKRLEQPDQLESSKTD